jgi:hypothetical protein
MYLLFNVINVYKKLRESPEISIADIFLAIKQLGLKRANSNNGRDEEIIYRDEENDETIKKREQELRKREEFAREMMEKRRKEIHEREEKEKGKYLIMERIYKEDGEKHKQDLNKMLEDSKKYWEQTKSNIDIITKKEEKRINFKKYYHVVDIMDGNENAESTEKKETQVQTQE